MPSNISKFGSLKGSSEHLENDDGRFGLVSTELHNEIPTPSGEHLYDQPGGYTWVCPAGVTSVSVVCVGGGGGGYQQGFFLSFFINGGGGGTLAYKNNFAVVPGQGYDLYVGAGGAAKTDTGFPVGNATGNDGETSWFNNTSTCAAGGGDGGHWLQGTVQQSQSAAPVGDGGGRGGFANIPGSLNNPTRAWQTGLQGAGSGAGGYTGDGGGYTAQPGTSGNSLALQSVPPAAGSGGGMHGYLGWDDLFGSKGMHGGPGGGVGVYGLGTTATQFGESGSNGRHASLPVPNPQYKAVFSASLGTYDIQPQNGSNTLNNAPNNRAGMYGGGGGGCGNYNSGSGATGDGANGAVRIIWGAGRAFPATLTDEASSVTVAYN